MHSFESFHHRVGMRVERSASRLVHRVQSVSSSPLASSPEERTPPSLPPKLSNAFSERKEEAGEEQVRAPCQRVDVGRYNYDSEAMR